MTQEAFLRLLAQAPVEKMSRRQCRAWLYKTAKNLYIDRLRKTAREVSAPMEDLEQAAFEEDLTGLAVEEFLCRLPPEEGTLFRMRYFQGYNARELGKMFDLPAATVRSRLLAARRKLVRWLIQDKP